MIEPIMDRMQVRFLYNGKYICCFYCENYAEMLKFLKYCKEYQIELWPNNFMELSKDKGELFSGISGIVGDFWYEFGDNNCMQTICVEIGVGDD